MENKTIPYFVFEGELTRAERQLKRVVFMCVLLIILLVGTNLAWLYYESQFEDKATTESIEAEQKGDENIISLGDVSYGTESEDNSNN